MSNIRRLPIPDRLTAEELHIVIHNASEKDKLWTLLKQVDFDQAMEVSIKPVGKDRSTMQNRMVWQWRAIRKNMTALSNHLAMR